MSDPESTNNHDEPVWFAFDASLRIGGDGIDFEDVSRTLGLQPTHFHRAGEGGGNALGPWKQDIWTYSPPIAEERSLEEHINALWDAIRPNIAYLRGLKDRHHVDVFCGYRTNCDHAGFEVDHKCLGLFSELEVPFGVSVILV